MNNGVVVVMFVSLPAPSITQAFRARARGVVAFILKPHLYPFFFLGMCDVDPVCYRGEGTQWLTIYSNMV